MKFLIEIVADHISKIHKAVLALLIELHQQISLVRFVRIMSNDYERPARFSLENRGTHSVQLMFSFALREVMQKKVKEVLTLFSLCEAK